VHRIWLPVRSVWLSLVPASCHSSGRERLENGMKNVISLLLMRSPLRFRIQVHVSDWPPFFPELFWHPAVKAKWVMCSDSVPRFSLFQFVIVSHFSYSYTLDHIWWKIIVLNLCWGITFFITSQLKKTMVHWKNCTRREIFKYLSKKICFYKYYMKDYS